MIDHGAACNAMPEDVAFSIISHGVDALADRSAERYPLVRMHKYRTPRSMGGVAAGRPLEVRYGVVLRAEFCHCGQGVRTVSGPVFQAVAQGFLRHSRLLSGFPTSGRPPVRSGPHRPGHAHCCEELGVALPPLELGRRSEYLASLAVYPESDGEKCAAMCGRPVRLAPNHCRLLRDAAAREFDAALCAYVVADCHACMLQPGEEALVPAVWDRPLALGARYCVSTTRAQLESGAEAQPGIWCSGARVEAGRSQFPNGAHDD